MVAADQALWQVVAQETRGKILTVGSPKPIDAAVALAKDSAEVMYHLLPLRDNKRALDEDSDKDKKKDKKHKADDKPKKKENWSRESSSPCRLLCTQRGQPKYLFWLQQEVVCSSWSSMQARLTCVLEDWLLWKACMA